MPHISSPVAENILFSLLAVNRWTLERVYALKDKLITAGLVDFDTVATLSVGDVAHRLAASGYDRGDYLTSLIAERVLSLASVLSKAELLEITNYVREGNREAADTILRQVKGVGSHVLRNFWLLQDVDA